MLPVQFVNLIVDSEGLYGAPLCQQHGMSHAWTHVST